VRAGAEVVVNDIRPDQAAEAVAELEAVGGVASALPFDVTDWDQVWSAVRGAHWQRFFAVNLFGVMHCTKAVLPSPASSRISPARSPSG